MRTNHGVFLLHFMHEITLNWICFRGINIFVLFLRICSGEIVAVIFSPTTANIDNEILPYLVQV